MKRANDETIQQTFFTTYNIEGIEQELKYVIKVLFFALLISKNQFYERSFWFPTITMLSFLIFLFA